MKEDTKYGTINPNACKWRFYINGNEEKFLNWKKNKKRTNAGNRAR